MADTTLLTLFQELMASYDSTIPTTSGSSFRTSVMDPLLDRIGDSPLDIDLETFLVDRLKTEHPTLDVSEGSGIRDLVIRPMVTMLAPLRREINAIAIAQSLNNYSKMTRSEVDALLGNFFLSIQTGSLATGSVRVYFSVPQAVVIDSLVKFSTSDGLNFFPSSIISITATTMSLNRDSGLFYVDVPAQAESTGTDYNIAAGKISKVETIIGAVKVTNPLGFQSGVADETKATAITRAKSSITTRTLATSRGISTLVTEQYANIDTLQVIGFGDPEMKRDIIEGPQSISGIPGGFEGAADVALPPSVHVGGKTDVYVYQPSRSSQTLDIKTITDSGRRIVRGSTGASPSAGSLDTFTDLNGQFLKNGVKIGDILRFGSDTIALVETAIISVSDDTVTSTAGTIPLGMNSQVYEIIRKEDIDLYVDVPIFDLAAVDGDGNTVLEGSDPVLPVPGDLSLSPLTFGGSNVAKTGALGINVANENVKTPFMRISSIDQLDPTQYTLTGVTYPHSDVLFSKAATDFKGGTSHIAATGSVTFNDTKGGSAGQIGDDDYIILRDSSGIDQRFLFHHSGSITLTVSNSEYATGTVICCLPTQINDGETVVINDGSNAYTFYFDKTGTYTPPVLNATNIEVDISSATTDIAVAFALNAQINTAAITIGSVPSGNKLILTHNVLAAASNQNTAITATVLSSDFSTIGMLGGTVTVDVSSTSTAYDIAAASRTAVLGNNIDITPGTAPSTGDALLSLACDVTGSAGNNPITVGGFGSFSNEISAVGMLGGSNGTKSSGTIRVYFGGAVGAFFPAKTTINFPATTFTDAAGNVFLPKYLGTVSATTVAGSNTFTTPGDNTSLLTRGTWISEGSSGAGLRMVGTAAVPTIHSSGTSTTTVRFDDTGFAYTTGATIAFDVNQGVNYNDITLDSSTGLYYKDVLVEATAVGASFNIADETVLTPANVYVEGWCIRNLESGSAFSTREKPYIRFSNYVNDLNFRKASSAYAVRLSYEYADTLADIQSFVEMDSNRIISEDILVKHFLPGLVSAKITLKGLTSDSATEAVTTFLETLSPSSTLEISDLVDYLYSSGATYVKLPIVLVVQTPSQDRVITALTTEDSVPLERIRHFMLETNGLQVTVTT